MASLRLPMSRIAGVAAPRPDLTALAAATALPPRAARLGSFGRGRLMYRPKQPVSGLGSFTVRQASGIQQCTDSAGQRTGIPTRFEFGGCGRGRWKTFGWQPASRPGVFWS